MATHAAEGRFVLQCCTECGAATYPPRDACPQCWGSLAWKDQPADATILAETTIRVTTDPYFRDHVPWRIGTVKLDAGPVALAHLHRDVKNGGSATMRLLLDRAGNAALFALPSQGSPNMADDPKYRQFTVSPKNRRVLISDGRTEVAQVLARELLRAGADTVFLGNSNPLLRFDRDAELQRIAGVQNVPLDVTNTQSVTELAAQLGGRIEIVVNTASFVRAGGVAFGGNLRDQKKAIEINVLGLSRLAQAFVPALVARAGDGESPAIAIVDILPTYALGGWAQFAGAAASTAARLSLQQSLRAEMCAQGVRVMTIFIGPVDDEWHQQVPPPKLLPAQIAKAVVDALECGREESCVGDVATDVVRRWRDDPKLALREMNR
jgi:NAD(P)-dependent dehydrogenase (short-subunit alcohol dehydrogenase family)